MINFILSALDVALCIAGVAFCFVALGIVGIVIGEFVSAVVRGRH